MYTEQDFIKDSQLIDKLMIINVAISQDEKLIKQASIANTLGGIANNVQTSVSNRIERDGVIATLLTYLSPMMLGKVWWPLKVLIPVASWFGFDIGQLFKSAIDLVTSIISNTGNFTKQDAANVANQVTKSITKGASLEVIRRLEVKGQIVDSFQGKLNKQALNFRGVNRGLGALFTSLPKRISKVLFGGFMRWFIMAVLMGLAAFEGPKILGVTPTSDKSKNETLTSDKPKVKLPGVPNFLTNVLAPTIENEQYNSKTRYNLPPKINHNLKPSGKGEQYHNNTDKTLWVFAKSDNVANTLWKWTKAIYPELAPYKKEIANSRSFNRMVSIIYNVNKKFQNSSYLQMPPNSGLHSWKDVVDRFVGDVANKIKKEGVK